MKIAGLVAVVLFCIAPESTADAQCFRGRCGVGVNVAVGAPAVRVNVGNRLRFRRGFRQRGVNINVGASSFVPSVSSFQFVQPASFVALPQPILGYGAGYAGYAGSDDSYLAQRLRQEAAETADIKDAIGELLGRLNEPVTAP